MAKSTTPPRRQGLAKFLVKARLCPDLQLLLFPPILFLCAIAHNPSLSQSRAAPWLPGSTPASGHFSPEQQNEIQISPRSLFKGLPSLWGSGRSKKATDSGPWEGFCPAPEHNPFWSDRNSTAEIKIFGLLQALESFWAHTPHRSHCRHPEHAVTAELKLESYAKAICSLRAWCNAPASSSSCTGCWSGCNSEGPTSGSARGPQAALPAPRNKTRCARKAVFF